MDGINGGGIQYIDMENRMYPKPLKEIYDPPEGLYAAGNAEALNGEMPAVAVVGSRKCSEYGLSAAYKLAKDLASCGIPIVSGMARGIDSMAHKGALDANGVTVAVLGCGVDICYPPENRNLMERIKEQGCVVSEHERGKRPLPAYFPRRNRIISGLCRALIVVEAEEKSGTNTTVQFAADAGREIFAVPGSIFSKTSIGTNNLIKHGVTPVTSFEDVLFGMRRYITVQTHTAGVGNEDVKDEGTELAPGERLVYDCLSLEPAGVDEIVHRTGITVPMAQYVFTTLELKGLIRRMPGQRYIKAV